VVVPREIIFLKRGGRKGGILLNPNRIIETKFAWGLGRETNNKAKMYGLFQGLRIAKGKGIKDIILLWDTLITIQNLIKDGIPKDNSLALVLQRIKGLMKIFHSKELYHVLRIHNAEVDIQENRACPFEETKLEINDSNYFCPIP